MIKPYSVERVNPLCTIIRIKYNSDLDQDFLLTADHHFDSKYCLRKKVKQDFQDAKDKQAGILMFGDIFDAMQGNRDPRSSKSALRNEYNEDDYLDLIKEDAVSFYGPYKEWIDIIGEGNHESSQVTHHGTNLISNLVQNLNYEHPEKSDIQQFGYKGWVFFRFEHESGGGRFTKKLYFNHGSGGNAIVTKGTLKPSRRAVYLPDADIVASGHIHEQWQFPITRRRISANGKLRYDQQMHLQIPSYKRDDEHLKTGGWEVEKEFPPQPVGAWWLKFRVEHGELKVKYERT